MMNWMFLMNLIDIIKVVGYVGVKMAVMHKSLLIADVKLMITKIR